MKSVHYALHDVDDRLPFSLDHSTGKVMVSQSLDHEATDEWRFVVEARTSNDIKSLSMVVVRVIDVNDNPPQFQVR